MSWHEDYLKRYKQHKSEGKSFFPFAVFKDAVMAALIIAVLFFLAHHFGAVLEAPADPTDSNYNPRPEWYFLFLFQALKLFPGKLEAVAAVVLPGLAVTFLLLLPFIDRSDKRHPLDRKFLTFLGVAVMAGMGFLTWKGYTSPLTNPIVEKDPEVMKGQRLYRKLNCTYCHRIGGKGGTAGPALDKSASGESTEWLVKHFRDPQSVSPGTIMPKLNLLDDEVAALVAYMKSFEAAPFSDEAPALFEQNCAVCHKLHGSGGELGPDLSLIASARDQAYIKRYIEDPSLSNRESTMPGFKGLLTELQIEDVARYLSQQK